MAVPLFTSGNAGGQNFGFLTGLPAGWVLSRASTGYCFDQNGGLQGRTANVPRIDYDPLTLTPLGLLVEDQRTNGVRNPRAEGSITGTIGSGGAAPSNWAAGGQNGIAAAIQGTGVETGLPYVDIRFFGTASAQANQTVLPENIGVIAAAVGDVWSTSAFIRQVGGSWGTPNANTLLLLELDSGGAQLASAGVTVTPVFSLGLCKQRVTYTRTLAQAATAFVVPKFLLGYPPGAVVDVTLRFGGFQTEKGTCTTSVILPTAGSPAATTRANDSLALNVAGSPSFNSPLGLSFVLECDMEGSTLPVLGGYAAATGFADTVYISTPGGNWNVTEINATVGASATDGAVQGPGVVVKAAVAVSPARAAFSVNASPVPAVASPGGVIPTPNQVVALGAPWAPGGAVSTPGHVRRVQLFNRAVSDGQLKALAT